MELKLKYQFGRIVPELTLTPSESQIFEEAHVPRHVTWTQMMVALGETNNPRYTKSTNKCESYQPMREYSREELRQATLRILADMRAMLAARLKPPIEVRGVADTPSPTVELNEVLNMALPSFLGEISDVENVQLMIGDQIFELNPRAIDTDIHASVREQAAERIRLVTESFKQMFDSYKAEFDQRYTRLREQIQASVIVPPSLSLTKMMQHSVIFFARSRTRESDRPRYWFQLPFKLQQTKIRIGEQLMRLKPEYRIIEGGFFTVSFHSNGQEASRSLTIDRNMQNALYHNHSLGGTSFCSGSYGHFTIDLTGDVIDQIVRYRNDMQDLLEVCNPSSWGTNMHNRAREMRNAYGRSQESVYMTPEQAEAEDREAREGGGRILDSDTGRGRGDVWMLTPDEIRDARQAPLRR